MTAVLLALLTAASYGVANYLGPILARSHPLAGILVVGQVVGVLGAGVLFAVSGFGHPGRSGILLGIAAGLLNGGAIAAFFRAASTGAISIVAPIGSTGAIVPVAVGIATGDRPSLLQLVGIPLAVIGVALAAARRGGRTDEHAVVTGAGLALVSAVLFGSFLTAFARASEHGAAAAVLTSRLALLTGTVVVVAALRLPWRLPLPAARAAVVPGLLLVVGTISYGAATTMGLLSVVSVLATLAPVVTVALAVVLLGERLTPRQQVGVGVALTGVVLLAAG